MKIYHLKRKNITRAAMLVTGMAGALLLATINPMVAQANPGATPKVGAAHTTTHTITCTTPPSGTHTNTPSGTHTSTPSGTHTSTPSGTDTSTPSGTDTSTPSGTDTSTPSGTDTSTPSGTDTSTPSGTDTTTPSGSTPTTTAGITAPVAPTGVTAIPGDGFAVVSWVAPASVGGSAIDGYLVMASPGEMFANTQGATTATVTGLTNGTTYTFTVIAFNAAGGSVSSAASAAVTPMVSLLTSTTPAVANAALANAAAANLTAANAAAANLTAANAEAANAPAAGFAVVPAGAPSTGAGGASQTSNGPLMGLGALALLLAGAATVPASRRRRRA